MALMLVHQLTGPRLLSTLALIGRIRDSPAHQTHTLSQLRLPQLTSLTSEPVTAAIAGSRSTLGMALAIDPVL